MSDVLKKLRRKHRKGSRLFSGHVKKKLESQPVKCEQFRKSLLGKSSDVERKESDERVHAFCCWCDHVGLELHPNVCSYFFFNSTSELLFIAAFFAVVKQNISVATCILYYCFWWFNYKKAEDLPLDYTYMPTLSQPPLSRDVHKPS